MKQEDRDFLLIAEDKLNKNNGIVATNLDKIESLIGLANYGKIESLLVGILNAEQQIGRIKQLKEQVLNKELTDGKKSRKSN